MSYNSLPKEPGLEAQGSIVIPEKINALNELGIAGSQIERAEQLAFATGEGLSQLVRQIHEVVAPDIEHSATEDVMHIQSPDGSNRRSLMEPSDRMAFMDEAAGLLRALADERNDASDNTLYLKRAANVVALSVVLTHTFADGNGRTARTAAHLIREGVDTATQESVNDLDVVSTNRPDKGFRINSYVPTGSGSNMTPVELLRAAAGVDIPLQEEVTYQTLKNGAFTTPYPD